MSVAEWLIREIEAVTPTWGEKPYIAPMAPKRFEREIDHIPDPPKKVTNKNVERISAMEIFSKTGSISRTVELSGESRVNIKRWVLASQRSRK